MIKSKNSKKIYLVTGVTGFVGSHLVNLLHSRGHHVTGLVRSRESIGKMKWVVPDKVLKKIEFIDGNVTDRVGIEHIFQEHRFDGVFYFAAQSSAPRSFKDPVGTFETNVVGTLNVVDAIARYQPKCRLVFASSGDVYGKQTGKLSEDLDLEPVTPYGVCKASAELYVRERSISTQITKKPLHFVVGRGFTSTGRGRERNFAFSGDAAQMARIIVKNNKPILNHGNLKSQRAVADIRDIVRGYYLLMQKGKPGEVYNIAGPKARRYGEYVDMLLDLAGLKGKAKLKKDPKLFRLVDIAVQVPVTTKIRKLGWKPEIPIKTTMKDLLEYWIERVKK